MLRSRGDRSGCSKVRRISDLVYIAPVPAKLHGYLRASMLLEFRPTSAWLLCSLVEMILGLKRATSQPQRRSSLCASSVARSGPFLAVGHLFECRWITVSVDRDLLGGSVNFAKIIRSEFDINRSDILLKTLQLRRAGNGNDPRFLC